ncbi:MAG: hypothetical protein RL172_1631 [Bacteroidota bacterium]|jgi:hypothetical protein
MNKLVVAAICVSFLVSCNAQQTSSNKKGSTTNRKVADMQAGKDYLILKRFRVIDKQGFNEPIEVSSFVLPANWQVNSDVRWNATNKCIPEMVQASLSATSPDGEYELMLLPATQFDWSDDPVYLDAMQRGFNLHSCHIAPPLDAAGYIRKVLSPNINAQVQSANIINELQQLMDAGANQQTQLARQGGNNAYSFRGSAAEGLLQFNDGKQGLAFCTIMQTIVTLGGTQGQMANTFQCYAAMRIVIKYKSGNEAAARKIMSTFFSSTRLNPTWFNGVQQFFSQVTSNAQGQIWKHTQEIRAVQQQMSNNIVRSWEAKSDASTAAYSKDTDGFGQYLRGVTNWTDADGNKVELTSGYSNAWSKGDGSYLVSNNPAFDPNVELGDTQTWNRMKQ